MSITTFNDLAHPNDNTNVTITISKYSADVLFNRLLIPENDEVKIIRTLIEYHDPKLLEQLWPLCSDRFKNEALFNKLFRHMMDKNGISYEEDLKRLNIPSIIGKD